jgi:hypothetical protein
MKMFKNAALAAVFMVIAASVMSVSAQGPLRKQIYFTINSPFEMGNDRVVLPAGEYLLHQVDQNDSNLFALYKDDRMHSPLAMVRTIRVDYLPGEYPRKTKMMVSTDEEASTVLPVINGWTISGMDGWEIIAMVPDRERIAMARSGLSRSKYKKERIQVITRASGF